MVAMRGGGGSGGPSPNNVVVVVVVVVVDVVVGKEPRRASAMVAMDNPYPTENEYAVEIHVNGTTVSADTT